MGGTWSGITWTQYGCFLSPGMVSQFLSILSLGNEGWKFSTKNLHLPRLSAYMFKRHFVLFCFVFWFIDLATLKIKSMGHFLFLLGTHWYGKDVTLQCWEYMVERVYYGGLIIGLSASSCPWPLVNPVPCMKHLWASLSSSINRDKNICHTKCNIQIIILNIPLYREKFPQ